MIRVEDLTIDFGTGRDKVSAVRGVSFFVNEGEIGVCSRNLELLEDARNSLWRVVNQYGLKEKLKNLGRNLALQGE